MSTHRSLSVTPMNRRRFLELSGAVTLTAAGLAVVSPQLAGAQATPSSAVGAFAGYPELKLTITDAEVTPSTTTVPAGYVLITTENHTQQSSEAGVLGPGPGQTMDDLKAE